MPDSPSNRPTDGPRERKHTQRRRILDAMIAIAGGEGYEAASVAAVIERAGMSRAGFEEHFADRDECFVAAVVEANERLLKRLRRAVERQAPRRAMAAAIEALVDFAVSEPRAARVLTDEVAVCGVRALSVRDRLIDELAQLIDRRHLCAGASAAIPDLPPGALIGGVQQLLAFKLRRGDLAPEQAGDLVTWCETYKRPYRQHRWRTLQRMPMPPASQYHSELLQASAVAPHDGEGSAEELTEFRRRRIIFAAAELASAQGCAATTLSAIAKAAAMDDAVVRDLFADERAVFAAMHLLHFQSVLAVTAAAFSGSGSWAKRVWEAGRAFAEAIEQSASFAHVTFVEFHAAGPQAVERHHEMVVAFAAFLQDGYVHRPEAAPTRVALEAIATTNFYAIYRIVRARQTSALSRFLPHGVHLSLTPFLGSLEANRFIMEQIEAQRHAGAQ